MEDTRSSKNYAMLSAVLGGIAGWIWIISMLSTPALIIWAIFGSDRWFYPLIAFAVGAFCKSLCREYKNQSEELFYASTGKDYASEWINLPEREKKQAVTEALKAVVCKYHPDRDLDELIVKFDESDHIDDLVNEITKGYEATRARNPYQKICYDFVHNYWFALPGIKKN